MKKQNNNKLKFLSICLIVAFAFTLLPTTILGSIQNAFANDYSSSITISNGDFEISSDTTTVDGYDVTLPTGWMKATDANYSQYVKVSRDIENQGTENETSVLHIGSTIGAVYTASKFGIKNTNSITLEADSFYELIYDIKVVDDPTDTEYNAFASIYIDALNYSQTDITPEGLWKTHKLYIESSTNISTNIALEFWLGSKTTEVIGDVYLDNVKLNKISPTKYFENKNAVGLAYTNFVSIKANITPAEFKTLSNWSVKDEKDDSVAITTWNSDPENGIYDNEHFTATFVNENEEIFKYTNRLIPSIAPVQLDDGYKLVVEVFKNTDDGKYYYTKTTTAENTNEYSNEVENAIVAGDGDVQSSADGNHHYTKKTVLYINSNILYQDDSNHDSRLPFDLIVEYYDNTSTQVYKLNDGTFNTTEDGTGSNVDSSIVTTQYSVSINETTYDLTHIDGNKYFVNSALVVFANKNNNYFFTKTASEVTFPVGSPVDQILKIENTSDTKKHTLVSPTFELEQFGYYKVSLYSKTNCEFGDESSSVNIKLVANLKTGKKPSGFDKSLTKQVIPYTTTNQITNNWTQYTFFVKGSTISTNGLTLQFEVATDSTIYVDNIEITRINYNGYSSASSTLDLNISNETDDNGEYLSLLEADSIANGHFNKVENIDYTLNGTTVTPTFPIAVTNWTKVETANAENVTSGIIPTNSTLINNYNIHNKLGLSNPTDIPSYNNLNALAIYASSPATYGYKSQSFSLSANSFYEIKFAVHKTDNNINAYSTLYSGSTIISNYSNITADNWTTYTYYLKTNSKESSLYIELGLKESSGTVLFTDVECNSIKEEDFLAKSTTDEENKIKTTLAEQKSNKYLIVDLSQENFTAHSFDYNDSVNKIYNSYSFTKTEDSTGVFGVINTEDNFTGTIFANIANLEYKNSKSNQVLALYNSDVTKHIQISQNFSTNLSANSYYKLAVWVKTANIDAGNGITLTFTNESADTTEPQVFTFTNVNTSGYANDDTNGYKEYCAYVKTGADSISDLKLVANFGTKETGLAGLAFIGEVNIVSSSKSDFNSAKKETNLQNTENVKFFDLTSTPTKTANKTKAKVDTVTIFFVVFSSLILVGTLAFAIIVVYTKRMPKHKSVAKTDKKITDANGESRRKGGFV